MVGAKVCVAADMPDMQHPGINKVCKEVGNGRDDAELTFGMGGAWAGAVTIAEPGKPPALVLFEVDVKWGALRLDSVGQQAPHRLVVRSRGRRW